MLPHTHTQTRAHMYTHIPIITEHKNNDEGDEKEKNRNSSERKVKHSIMIFCLLLAPPSFFIINLKHFIKICAIIFTRYGSWNRCYCVIKHCVSIVSHILCVSIRNIPKLFTSSWPTRIQTMIKSSTPIKYGKNGKGREKKKEKWKGEQRQAIVKGNFPLSIAWNSIDDPFLVPMKININNRSMWKESSHSSSCCCCCWHCCYGSRKKVNKKKRIDFIYPYQQSQKISFTFMRHTIWENG